MVKDHSDSYPICGMVYMKEPLLLRVAHAAAADFLSRYHMSDAIEP